MIQYYQNGDLLSEMAAKILLSPSIVDKYKLPKCIGHLFGHARKTKTRVTIDRLIQCKIKLDRRKSSSTVKVEIENERGISLHIDPIRKRAHEVGQVA